MIDFIIVGQGIAGTLLSFELLRNGKSVLVIDQRSSPQSSSVSGAVLNPFVLNARGSSQDRNDQISIALKLYLQLQEFLNCHLLSKMSLLKFPVSEKENTDLLTRVEKSEPGFYRTGKAENEILRKAFLSDYEAVKIDPVWKLNNNTLLDVWREFLQKNNLLLDEEFIYSDCLISGSLISYKSLAAGNIIFCEGASVRKNPFIDSSRFVPNRGDTLLAEIHDLNSAYIFQQNLRLIPLENNLYWIGSNYQWDFKDLDPDLRWRSEVESKLHNWLKIPFKIKSHQVAERPTTAGQQTFSGMVPGHKNVFWLNGLGTKGFSAAPGLVADMLQLLLR